MGETRFFRMSAPEYESDHQHSFINGSLDHPFGLPGVRCDTCGDTWGGTRILPHACPEELRTRKELRDRWPISSADHRALRREVSARLHEEGQPEVRLRPGDDFQPCYLDVPSRPRADFLWASLGSVVVSDRVRLVLSELVPEGLAFVPVDLRKIGEREAHLPAPVPASGEPEDIIHIVELLPNTEGVGPYYEMIVATESAPPHGIPGHETCEGCDRPLFDRNARVLAMYPDMWRGRQVFMFATTLWIVVTDEARRTLQAMRATNVVFQPVVPHSAA